MSVTLSDGRPGSAARECADVNKMHDVESLSDLAARPHGGLRYGRSVKGTQAVFLLFLLHGDWVRLVGRKFKREVSDASYNPDVS